MERGRGRVSTSYSPLIRYQSFSKSVPLNYELQTFLRGVFLFFSLVRQDGYSGMELDVSFFSHESLELPRIGDFPSPRSYGL